MTDTLASRIPSVLAAKRSLVTSFLPGWLVDRLMGVDRPPGGLTSLIQDCYRAPTNAAEVEAYGELLEMGCLVLRRGWPDFFVMPNQDDLFFVEVKGPGDEIRPAQMVVLETLASRGIDVYVRRPSGYEAVGDSRPWSERVQVS